MNEHLLEAFDYNQHLVAYLNIVNYWKSHKAEGNIQKHHIVPRSFFKNSNLPCDDSEDNLVCLPYAEHQKIHRLAILCAKDIIKIAMINAYNLMIGKNGGEVFKELIKDEKFYSNFCESLKGKWNNQDYRNKMSNLMKSNNPAKLDSSRKKNSEWHKGKYTGDDNPMANPEIREKHKEAVMKWYSDHPGEKHHSEETKNIIRSKITGIKRSEECKEKHRNFRHSEEELLKMRKPKSEETRARQKAFQSKRAEAFHNRLDKSITWKEFIHNYKA